MTTAETTIKTEAAAVLHCEVRFTGWGKQGETVAEIAENKIITVENGENERLLTILQEFQPGKQVAVTGGIPGEEGTVEVRVRLRPFHSSRRKRKPQPYIDLRIIEIRNESEFRVTAPCEHFGVCGGCQYQHIDYAEQLRMKRQYVLDTLRAEVEGLDADVVLAVLPGDIPWNYRNHMRFSVNRQGQAGLTEHNSHKVIPLDRCPIAHPNINKALAVFAEQVDSGSDENRYILRQPQVLVRTGTRTGQILFQPVMAEEVSKAVEAEGLEIRTDMFEEELHGHRFLVRPSSFFQTNTAQADKMVEVVLGMLPADKTATVVDAYCGVGTFARCLADRAKEVIAIEESASAVADAHLNVAGAENITVIQGKTEHVLPTLQMQIDSILLDPPRQGCQQPVLDAIIERAVPAVIYISCDPTSLARDVRYLCETKGGYRVEKVQPIDMFPHTAHIESVTLLSRAGV